MTMHNTPLPPPADNAIARTARFVGAAAPSLLVVGLADASAWGPASSDSGAAFAWQVLAVLLTLAALVWVTPLFIRALRSGLPPPPLAQRPVR